MIKENKLMKKKKYDFPRLYENKENCCGCSTCFALCPVSAIEMVEDEEGFLYPSLNESKCIRCYKCLEVCVFKDNQL